MHMNKGNKMGLLFNTLTATEMSINPRLVHDKLLWILQLYIVITDGGY